MDGRLMSTDDYDKKGNPDKEKKSSNDEAEFLRLARKRFDQSYEADRHNRSNYERDVEFSMTDDQWPSEVKKIRGENRPCLTVNKLNAVLKQMAGDYRQNEIAIKVRPANGDASKEIADIFDGIIRNIEQQSFADIAYTTAFECAARGGFGIWRVLTEYSDDDTFEQDIRIRRETNPLAYYFDPQAKERDKSDARWWFVRDQIPKEDFKELYPNVNLDDFGDRSENDYQQWYDDDTVTIAEYWLKKPYNKKIALLSDGTTINLDEEGAEEALELLQSDPENPVTIVKEREVVCQRIHFYKICGHAILEEAIWPGKYIPIIYVPGEEVNLKGKTHTFSAIYHSKDAQRMYNYWKTAATEAIALAPKAPFLLTPEQIEDHQNQWNRANTDNLPYMLYNAQPNAPPPQRQQPAIVPTAEISMAMGASDDIKATTGIYDASLGAQGNEKSGKAILARQREGDNATFTFLDNMASAIAYCGTVLVDLIPRIYDTDKIIRTIGVDGAAKMVPINKSMVLPDGEEIILNDLSQGKYDIAVTTGLSYATRRMESADGMMQFMQTNPQAAQYIMDLVAKNMDWPGSQEIADRLSKLLPPGLQNTDDPKAQEQIQQQQQQQQMQQQMMMQMEAQKQQQAFALEQAKIENEKFKVVAERERTQAERERTQLEHRRLDVEEHERRIHQTAIALQSGGFNTPYIPQGNQSEQI
jgi:hypothetical protein